MIVTTLLKLINTIFQAVFGFIPAWTLPEGFTNAISSGIANIGLFSGVFPVFTLMTILLLMVSFDLNLLLFKLVNGLIALIRGSGKVDL